MGRRRPIDWVNWRLYQRAWLLCGLALLLVVATSFRPQTPPQPAMPPTFTNEAAEELIASARDFEARFPDRRPGSPGALDSAQWVRAELRRSGLAATAVPDTTLAPGSRSPVPVINVEALLPGRTRETVVILAHRDNAGPQSPSGAPVSTMALIRLGEELAATRDRRRTYMLVSTDAATVNGAGARALAQRLQHAPGPVIALISLDRISQGVEPLYVPFTPSDGHAPPLGLTLAALDAVAAEGGVGYPPPITTQLLRLAAPVTLFEQGQLIREGWPATTLTTAPERSTATGPAEKDAETVAAAMRALQRLTGTLDGVDSLQSAGKTYVMSSERVFRGWALKLFIASMLFPVWIACVDMLVRQRRRWNVAGAIGTTARAMIGGLWVLATLWLVGAIGLLPIATDHPPHPDTLGDVPVIGLLTWLLLGTAGWLLCRAPDWRRRTVEGCDYPVLVMALLALGVLAALALSVNPYAVLFALPAMHAWLWLLSRRVFGVRAVTAVWLAGLTGPLAAGLVVSSTFELGAAAPWYWLELIHTRTVPASLSLLMACGAGLAALLPIAALGRVGDPALPRLRMLAMQSGRGRGAARATRRIAIDGLAAREGTGTQRRRRRQVAPEAPPARRRGTTTAGRSPSSDTSDAVRNHLKSR